MLFSEKQLKSRMISCFTVCYEVLNNIVPNYILLVKDYQNFIFCGDLQKLQLFSGILQPFGAAVKILCFHPLDAAKGATIDEPKR